MTRQLERATILGAGLGLVFGSLLMWHTDPTTSTLGIASGLALLAITLATRKRAREVA